MTKAEVEERLRDSGNSAMLKALDLGWAPPEFEDAIEWWTDTMASDPTDNIESVLDLATEYTPEAVMLDEVFGFYEADAQTFMGELKMICIYSEEMTRPYLACVPVGDQGPEDAVKRWVTDQWGEDLRNLTMTPADIHAMNPKYFWVDPTVGISVQEAEDNAGNDSEGDVANTLRYRICREAEIKQ